MAQALGLIGNVAGGSSGWSLTAMENFNYGADYTIEHMVPSICILEVQTPHGQIHTGMIIPTADYAVYILVSASHIDYIAYFTATTFKLTNSAISGASSKTAYIALASIGT